MTGYSRSAATCTLAAELLDAMTNKPYDHLYAYTFATPAGTQQPKAVKGLYNIIYGEDLVPRVALEAWGFGRNGTNLFFTTDSTKLKEEGAA